MTAINKKKKPIKIVIILIVSVLAVAFCVGGFNALQVYSSIFKNIQTREPLLKKLSSYDGLQVEECTFSSDSGQQLAGYQYSKKGLVPKGVVIIAHGLGNGGQNVYMDAADYFTSNHYLVFAYDATGVDNSEGDSAIGMEQGIIDLNYAIDYVENDDEMKKYPIVLFGHSWGAYSVDAVLNLHPEVKAVVSISGFNKPSDLYQNSTLKTNPMLLFYFDIIEKIKFGKYTDDTALSGFANSNAGVLIIQSKDDRNVPVEAGYNMFYAKYADDPRFQFHLLENRGHLFIYYTDAASEYDRLFVQDTTGTATEYAASHTYDPAQGQVIDTALFQEMLALYDEYCK